MAAQDRAAKVDLPATLLRVACILAIAWLVIVIAFRVMDAGGEGSAFVFYGLSGGFGIVVLASMVRGTYYIHERTNYAYGFATAILAIVPIWGLLNCVAVAVTAPIGIWLLIVLLSPDVKAAFGSAISRGGGAGTRDPSGW